MALGMPDHGRTVDDHQLDIRSLPDDVLVRRLIGGSQAALAELYDRHSRSVYAAGFRVSRDPGIAADAVQDTFLALWDRAELYDASLGSLRAWLHTIARNRTVDRLRASRRHDRAVAFSSFETADGDDGPVAEWLVASGSPVGMAGADPGPEESLARQETRQTLAAALQSLAPNERTVIELAYAGGLSQSEVAERLGWPIGTVKTRTRRALHLLHDRLETTARA